MAILFIDGDVLPYEIGFGMEKDFVPDWPEVKTKVDEKILELVAAGNERFNEGCEHEVWLSDDNNFRTQWTKICTYKGNRDGRRPAHYDGIRNYLRDAHGGRSVPLLEGDDIIAIRHAEVEGPRAIVSIDKDFNQLAGVRWSWPRNGYQGTWYEVDDQQARVAFWTSVLVGDRVDNIPGLFGVGPKSELVKHLYTLKTHKEMFEHVFKEYERRFGYYTPHFFADNVRMLKLVEERTEYPWEYSTKWLLEVTNE